MQLIQKARLFFQAGSSDKVYEVDLCEVGPGEYVVNFRYGRRGAKLAEGTKTVFPVPIDKAQKEFDKLVNGKKKKGYSDQPDVASESSANDTPKRSSGGTTMAEKVLEYLAAAAANTYDEEQWKLSRVIWRAGELKLSDATAHLIKIPLRPKDEMFNYSLAWALGRCGDAEAVPKLKELMGLKQEKVSRIAGEAILMHANESDKRALVYHTIANFPERLQKAVQAQDTKEIRAILKEYLGQSKDGHNDLLYLLYRIESELPFLRAEVVRGIAKIKLQPPYFRAIRRIYKSAEMRDDDEVIGILSIRMEKQRHFFMKPSWGSMYIRGKWAKPEEELSKPDSTLAYSDRTRIHFLQRTRRSLDNLARTGGAFTRLARYILLQYKDGEGAAAGQETFWSWDYVNGSWKSTSITKYYPAMSNFNLLYYLLYANSIRFMAGASGAKWRYRPPAKPGEPVPDHREEAHPKLWDEAPEDLVALLVESRCQPVVEFAAKAFMKNPRRADHINTKLILGLLNSPYELANGLGLELAREHYDPANPDQELLLALLACSLEDARSLGMNWATDAKSKLFADAEFLTAVLLTRHPRVRSWVSTQVKSMYLRDTLTNPVVNDVIAALFKIDTEEAEGWEQGWMSEVVDQIQLLFPDSLRKIPEAVILSLTAHPWENMQLLGGRILLHYFEPKSNIPEVALESLINSDWSAVRGLGVEVFGQLPEEVLKSRKDIVAGFCVSKHAEIRKQAGPIVARLIRTDADFARGLLELFVPALWRKERHEGVHEDILVLVKDVLKDHLAQLPAAHTWKLIDSEFRAAHELGHLLLKSYSDPEKLALAKIVKLGSHELLDLRKYVQDYFTANVPRIRYEREEALKLLDASWEDSRQFAIGYFGEQFSQDDWTPDLLVSICDSVREELQQFGQQMITRFFREQDGDQYLLKLSQHPKAELQLFVTNYLERFAAGNVERILGLDFYFHAVLSQVNKGRVAKERVFSFLKREALANVEVAAYVIPLMNRIVLTIAKRDKTHCIRILTDLRYKYPHLESPLKLQSFTAL